MSTSTKRRLKVVLDLDPDDEGAVRGAKRQRKLVVPMEKDSTVDDLRKELLKDIGHDAEDIALQIDGFELRLEDSLDVVVEDSEVIHGLVKVATCAVTQLECSPPQNSSLDFDAEKCDVEMKDDFSPGHYQVHLVSAELARQHAKSNPKNTTPAMNGLPAFGGKFINRFPPP
ncbi:hypothetical protein ONZ45_g5456 [Pleurotus djamor]|nr:hypothetical protein ONZ45_g5456 [Pleurotus djamor]